MAVKAPRTTILVDGDVFAYRVAAAAEEAIDWGNGTATFNADLPDAMSKLDDLLGEFSDRFAASKTMVALTVPRNFRYDVLPTYKGNRRGVRKPILLRALKDHLTDKWGAQTKPLLEADDVLGIWSTWPKLKGKKIVISLDKDLRQIPGWFWDTKSETAIRISPGVADQWHYTQTLIGDVTDGYKGCPGVGPVAAKRILNLDEDAIKGGPIGDEAHGIIWRAIVKAYEAKGLTEEDALVQARVARICRASDYDFDKKEPIYWTPKT
jgi:DNA polymerase-1